MPKYQERADAGLDRMFHALADGSRRAMVERLALSPASMSELARPLNMSLPAVLQHLAALESAGILSSQKVGRVRTYQLAVGALSPCAGWIARQRLPAERRLDRLGDYLDTQPPIGEPTKHQPGEAETP